MIDFYTFQTSNAQRVGIMLEACELRYERHVVDLQKGEQRAPAFLALNPAGAVPVIVDADAPGGRLVISQSGAIMLHLAAKTGRFLPHDPARRASAFQWFMFATTDCATATSMIYFSTSVLPDKSPSNVAFFEQRLLRYFELADERLRGREWLADELSIADFALYPIVAARRALAETRALPDLSRWSSALASRKDVASGIAAANGR